jgi:predicted CoA-binding protein
MTAMKEAAAEFLGNKRVAVTGVSRTPGNHGSNVVYKRLRDRGYEVFAINPNADEVEGDRAYHDLHSIPCGVETVVIGTRPEIADKTMRECATTYYASTASASSTAAAPASGQPPISGTRRCESSSR